jgi:16S rRNA (adenine1518-N6/adenine1519-N6)-dimethyltransferase
MKLSEMRRVLEEGGIRLTKSLGQNFLHDANQLRRIVESAELAPGDRVLEIGPGLGPLTEVLLEKAGEVLAIEKDRRLAAFLRQRFSSARNLTLVEDDALDYLRRAPRDWSEWKLVSNLPYAVASALLVQLAQAQQPPRRLTATLQLEVAKRLVAHAEQKDYGVLTLLCQLSYEPQGWFKIPAGCFFPQPEVDSACVSLQRRAAPLLGRELRPAFEKLVKRAFSQRRKIMFKLLKADWPEERLEAASERLALPPRARAETIRLEQFVALTELLAGAASPFVSSRTTGEEIFDVVNERDEVVGQNTRSEVHRLGLKHRAVHVLVFNSRGEVFLQKRSLRKDRQPGLWDSSASGHVDSGETYEACAARELREEIGLDARTPLQPLFKLPACAETDQEHVWVYRHEAEGPFALDPEEIERGEWRAPEAVTRWMAERPQDFASALLFLWQRLDLCNPVR